MRNIISYILWRGDLTLDIRPFNEVDNLILSMLAYLDLSDVVPPPGMGSVALKSAADAYFGEHAPSESLESSWNSEDPLRYLFYLMAQSPRFCDMQLSNRSSILNIETAEQFYAITVQMDAQNLYLAFRGTSDDLAGWKEDFLLACISEIPSQAEAGQYLQIVANQYQALHLMLGGHSKGGNLAVYAAATAPEEIQRRIVAIWNNDGPGFQNEFMDQAGYRNISHKIQMIVPKSSVVGMLLAHEDAYRIVDSSQMGLLQHDGLSWEVERDHFAEMQERTAQSIQSDNMIRQWISSIPIEERKQFVDAMFDILYASGASTLSELRRDRIKTISATLPMMNDLPKDIRNHIMEFLILLGRITNRLALESKLSAYLE